MASNSLDAIREQTLGLLSGLVVDENGISRTVQRSFVNASSSGNTQVVAARGAGIRIRVLAFYAVSAGACTVKFQSATTDIAPGTSFAANGGIVVPLNHNGWFQTAANEALNINLSASVATGAMVNWIEAA